MSDDALLLDMLLAARQVSKYVSALIWERFAEDQAQQDAVAYQVQIIGEAATRVSEEFRRAHPEIPWARITGMRHRLVHNYRDVRHDVLWSTAQDAIPELIKLLEPLIPPEEES